MKSSRRHTILVVTMFRKSGGSALRSLVLTDQKGEANEICVVGHFITSHDNRDLGWIGGLLLG